MQLSGPLLSPSLKKNPPPWKFFLFQEMELSSDYNRTRTHNHLIRKRTLNHLAKVPSRLKTGLKILGLRLTKFLYFLKKNFFNISGNRTFQEIKLSSSKIKKFLIFRKMELFSVIFFLYFRKDFPSSKNKKTL